MTVYADLSGHIGFAETVVNLRVAEAQTASTNIAGASNACDGSVVIVGTSIPGGVSEIDFWFKSFCRRSTHGGGISNVDDGHIAALANGPLRLSGRSMSTSFFADNSGFSIHGMIMGASGRQVGMEFLVNTATFGDQVNPDILALKNGDFFVTWQTMTLSIRFSARSSPLPKFFESPMSCPLAAKSTISRSVGFNATPSLTELADGRIAVAFQSPDFSGMGFTSRLLIFSGWITGFDDNATFYGSADNTSDSIVAQGLNDTSSGLAATISFEEGRETTFERWHGRRYHVRGCGNDTYLVDNAFDKVLRMWAAAPTRFLPASIMRCRRVRKWKLCARTPAPLG